MVRSVLLVVLVLVPAISHAHVGGNESANPWANWPVSADILIPVLLAAYLYVAGWLRRRDHASVVGWRHASFFAGLAALLVALQSPLDVLAEHSFTMHQLQHLFLRAMGPMLIMLAAPQGLLIAGTPQTVRHYVYRPILGSTAVKAIFRFFAHPLVATILLLAIPIFWHLPEYHNLSVLNVPVHYVMHVTMLVSGLFFFWRVLDPRPAPLGASYGTRVVMSWAAIAGNIPFGAYIALKSTVLYRAYDVNGRLWDLVALADEQLGGFVIWIPGSMMFVVLLLIVIRLWGAREAKIDALRQRGIAPHGMPASAQAVANRRLAHRLLSIAGVVLAGVAAVAALQRLLP